MYKTIKTKEKFIKWKPWTHKVQHQRTTEKHYNIRQREPEMEVKVEDQNPNTDPLQCSSKSVHLIVFSLRLHR